MTFREAIDRSNNPDLEGRMQGAAADPGPLERSGGSPIAASENCALLHGAI
jgi:hypothetical protein